MKASVVWSIRLGALLLLSGCGSLPIHGDLLAYVCIAPVWSTPAEIREMCGPTANACAEVGQYDGQIRRLWLERPEFFDDRKTASLGHEVLHSLGATH